MDLLFWIGGDEFIVLLFYWDDEVEFVDWIDGIRVEVVWLFCYKNVNIDIFISIGVVVMLGGCVCFEDLVCYVDIVFYEVKCFGWNCYVVYFDEMGQVVLERFIIEIDLQDVFVCNQFCLYFQFWVDMYMGCVVFVEVFVCWYYLECGILMFDDFIEICEEMGFLEVLGNFVLYQVFVFVRGWNVCGLDIGILVNVLFCQFLNVIFIENLECIVVEFGFKWEMIEFEIVEFIIVGDQDFVVVCF